ncbi:MAG: Ureidoglycolate hydrolase [Pleurocapsa sp. SU_5_0]|nr:Ureidoglycolate hydrolase [Pleurocapsa sp. SU_5_0]NJO94705.1 Ureidoglycolate hydrolase [Pleurocapsa sp. CRU_1_2]NJR44680.1 Ureidoglycolate hydrolase [Hyellaceae cyanobacterium CSU_1_1]
MPLLTVKQLVAIAISKSNFKPYGQLIIPSPDGKVFDQNDAVLQLQNGTPRFYIMHLERRGRTFTQITRHHSCTQCLGSLNGKDWLMAVCPPSDLAEPDLNHLRAFSIPGDCFIKLEVGTWHAGPYFDHPAVDFYNLELSDTNIVDHFTHNFASKQNIKFEIIDA